MKIHGKTYSFDSELNTWQSYLIWVKGRRQFLVGDRVLIGSDIAEKNSWTTIEEFFPRFKVIFV